ncbi:hypothetical protein MLD38_004423 [Melastoma candidum]|uniref:Uncharacterized protein n=1 Tax=Melastoma candidum TaxID=119954 RepID=A0ACB9SAA6_9MYRT|nr:hypothetical protein MLD38_004423 [Melastoma candidum]
MRIMESQPNSAVYSILITVSLLILAMNPAHAISIPQESLPTKSGYLPVSPSSNSSIFFAFYEAQQPSDPLPLTPILIWLQGGPGCSSMLGNFLELGPWIVSPDLSLHPNPGSWNRLFGLLFLDNPIGVGFSVAASPEEIPRDQPSVAEHLFAAIKGFVGLDPSFRSRPIFVTGESYAGKYVPAIGYHILRKNAESPAEDWLQLRGVAIGNGLTDPVTQVGTHASNAYFSGLINERQRRKLERIQSKAIELTRGGLWQNATKARLEVLDELQNMTGLATLFDLERKKPYESRFVKELLSDGEVREAMGATKGGGEFSVCSTRVGEALAEDVMKSAKGMVEYIVTKRKVLLYQGQRDLRDGVVATEAWVRGMEWEGREAFARAERKVWKAKGELAGYVQSWGRLSHTVVLGAGHLVPADQPGNAQAMIEDWVLGRGLFGDDGNGE